MLILESVQNILGVCYRQGNVLKARRDTKKKKGLLGGQASLLSVVNVRLKSKKMT